MSEARLELARERLTQATSVAVLTGAGISVESGIPTFRCEDGIWKSPCTINILGLLRGGGLMTQVPLPEPGVPAVLGNFDSLEVLFQPGTRYKPFHSGIGLNADCPNLLIQHHLREIVDKALKREKKRVHVIGHSLGGVLARAVASQMSPIKPPCIGPVSKPWAVPTRVASAASRFSNVLCTAFVRASVREVSVLVWFAGRGIYV